MSSVEIYAKCMWLIFISQKQLSGFSKMQVLSSYFTVKVCYSAFSMIHCSPHDRPSASVYSPFLLLLSFTMVFSLTALLRVPRMHQALSSLHGLTHVSIYLESSLGSLLSALLFKRELSSLLGEDFTKLTARRYSLNVC